MAQIARWAPRDGGGGDGIAQQQGVFFVPAGGGGNHWDVDDVPFGYLT